MFSDLSFCPVSMETVIAFEKNLYHYFLKHFYIFYVSTPLVFQLDIIRLFVGLPWWLSSKELTCNAGASGDMDSFPAWG